MTITMEGLTVAFVYVGSLINPLSLSTVSLVFSQVFHCRKYFLPRFISGQLGWDTGIPRALPFGHN
jgi:hypothetical protein